MPDGPAPGAWAPGGRAPAGWVPSVRLPEDATPEDETPGVARPEAAPPAAAEPVAGGDVLATGYGSKPPARPAGPSTVGVRQGDAVASGGLALMPSPGRFPHALAAWAPASVVGTAGWPDDGPALGRVTGSPRAGVKKMFGAALTGGAGSGAGMGALSGAATGPAAAPGVWRSGPGLQAGGAPATGWGRRGASGSPPTRTEPVTGPNRTGPLTRLGRWGPGSAAVPPLGWAGHDRAVGATGACALGP
ncbi:hypothetical protein I6A62_13795 [Frankia sp. AgW1.1]|nr:hypothetical protein [Frankia sp. AgW1.1]